MALKKERVVPAALGNHLLFMWEKLDPIGVTGNYVLTKE